MHFHSNPQPQISAHVRQLQLAPYQQQLIQGEDRQSLQDRLLERTEEA